MRHMAIFYIVFGFFYLISGFLFFSKTLSIFGLIPIVIGYYFKGRSAEFVDIDEDSVTLSLGDKEVRLSKEIIISVTKSVRFTVTENYFLIITFYKNDNKGKERYFFFNEPKYNLLESFKNMGVKLRNVP